MHHRDRHLLASAACALTLAALGASPAQARIQTGPDQGVGAEPAAPQSPAGGRFAARFAAANTSHDGRLTQLQAQQAGLQGIARHFDQIDTDHKGFVTLADVQAYRLARKAARGQRS